jgi:tetratricopeptide (TPR) repeat protein
MRTNNEILIDYLDQDLTPEESAQVENQISNDSELATDLAYLNLAVSSIRQHAINEVVSKVRKSAEGMPDNRTQPVTGVVRNLFKISLRVAAILILVIGLSTLYKFLSVNDQSVYEKQFINYSLNTTRGAGERDPQSEAYQNKNWSEVITLFKKETNKTNRSYFLAGISEMQLDHFPEAITCFETILNSNTIQSDRSYEDESEYYISLAYLMNHEENKAIAMLKKIRADKNHKYYPIASQLSLIDLKIIGLKK